MSSSSNNTPFTQTKETQPQLEQQPQKQQPNPKSLPTTLQTQILPSSLSASASSSILKHTTEILLQLYQDRIFLIITQLSGKIGTLLQCTAEYSIIDNSTTYNLQTLLGSTRNEDPTYNVLVRTLHERIGKVSASGNSGGSNGNCVPLLVGMGLKRDARTKQCELSREEFHVIVDRVVDLYGEAVHVVNAGRGC